MSIEYDEGFREGVRRALECFMSKEPCDCGRCTWCRICALVEPDDIAVVASAARGAGFPVDRAKVVEARMFLEERVDEPDDIREGPVEIPELTRYLIGRPPTGAFFTAPFPLEVRYECGCVETVAAGVEVNRERRCKEHDAAWKEAVSRPDCRPSPFDGAFDLDECTIEIESAPSGLMRVDRAGRVVDDPDTSAGGGGGGSLEGRAR